MPLKSQRIVLIPTKGRRHRLKNNRSLSVINRYLSKKVNHKKVLDDYPVIEVKDGVATNMDFNNPQHLKWMED